MADLPRMQIHELALRYELEPNLRDVFVEGVFDRELLSEWAARRGCDQIFYEIDSVDVPDEVLRRHGLTRGNKQEVMALARELSVIEKDCAYRCLVDRDLDQWLGKLEVIPRLCWTGSTAIETYFLTSDFVRRCVVLVARSKIEDWTEFFSSFVAVLRKMYAIRLADRDLMWCMNWLPFGKSLALSGGRLSFDSGGYVEKLLKANARWAGRDVFEGKVADWGGALVGEDGECVRGHDFVFLMAWAIGKSSGLKSYADEAALERLLVLCAHEVDGFEAMLA